MIAAVDDAPLLYMKLFANEGKNLLWYLAVLGFVVTLTSDQDGDGKGKGGGGARAADA